MDGLLPVRSQVTIWNNAELFLIGPFGAYASESKIERPQSSYKKKDSKWRLKSRSGFVHASIC